MKNKSLITKTIKNYNLYEELGEGSFSKVFRGINKNNNQVYAIKIFPKSNLEDSGDQERFQREINAMAFMKHESIVLLHDFFWDEINFYLVLDFCPGGELFDYIVDNDKLDEPVAAFVFRQIVSAVAFCHSFGVAHRDLKPENVLIVKFPYIKVSDFGLCGFISDGTLMKTFCGSPCYCAPECLCRVQYDGRISDIWSLGVILFSMVTGEHPWNISNTSHMLRQILKGSYIMPSYLSNDCKELIAGMLNINSKDRFSMENIVNHKWLKNALYFSPGKNLSTSISLPPLQSKSIADLSDISSKSSQRSDSGIFSPFIENDEETDIPGFGIRSTSLTKFNLITDKKKESKKLVNNSLSMSQNRQRSSSNLLNQKIVPTKTTLMTISED